MRQPGTWLMLGLVLLALGFVGINYWFHLHVLKLRAEYLLAGSWQRVISKHEIWCCPYCAMPCYSWGLVLLHQNAETSPCAAMTAERARGGRTAGQEHHSALVSNPGDVTGGRVDSLEDDPGSGENRDAA